MAQKNMEKAERNSSKIIQTETESPSLYLNLALISMQIERAEAECKRYLDLGFEKPESPSPYLNLALISMHMERAEAEYKGYFDEGFK